LLGLARIKTHNEPALPRITAAADVSNPLLGLHGATRTFGPQKGATPEQLELLERSLTCLAEVVAGTFHCDYRDVAGAGAAGGLGFGLLTFCNARMQSGFEVVAEAIALRAKVERADIVITGEGKLDRQTLAGKAPAGLARMARELNKPVFAIVGQMKDEPGVRELFDGIVALGNGGPDYRDSARQIQMRARELALTASVFAR
jgi:glycerate 2-kinase